MEMEMQSHGATETAQTEFHEAPTFRSLVMSP